MTRSLVQYFICPSEGLPEPHREVKIRKLQEKKKKNMLLSHFCTNIATQPNYLACTKTSLICCSQKDVRDFKRLGQVEKHFPFILPLLSTFHLLQWACFVLLCFVLFSCKTMLKENCFLGGSNLKRLSFPPM